MGHSYECETCGVYRDGLNDLRCDCDDDELILSSLAPIVVGRFVRFCALDCLASNLRIAGALCRADLNGASRGANQVWTRNDNKYADRDPWEPGCRRAAP